MKTREIKKFRDSYTKYDKDCVFEGYKLAVHFDEKDMVKKYGGRWDADEQTWWMPESKLLVEVHEPIGMLVRDWLNDSEMIMGQYGKFNETEHTKSLIDNGHYTEYNLFPPSDEDRGCPKFKVRFFYNQDVATFLHNEYGGWKTEYLTIEDGRKRWDELIANGYNRVEKP